MFWGGQVHGDGSLDVLVGGPNPLALPRDHMVVVDLALGVSGCPPVLGELKSVGGGGGREARGSGVGAGICC